MVVLCCGCLCLVLCCVVLCCVVLLCLSCLVLWLSCGCLVMILSTFLFPCLLLSSPLLSCLVVLSCGCLVIVLPFLVWSFVLFRLLFFHKDQSIFLWSSLIRESIRVLSRVEFVLFCVAVSFFSSSRWACFSWKQEVWTMHLWTRFRVFISSSFVVILSSCFGLVLFLIISSCLCSCLGHNLLVLLWLVFCCLAIVLSYLFLSCLGLIGSCLPLLFIFRFR